MWLTYIYSWSQRRILCVTCYNFYISAVLRLFGFGVPPNIEGRMENSSYKSPHNIEYVILSNDIDWNLELLVVKHGIAWFHVRLVEEGNFWVLALNPVPIYCNVSRKHGIVSNVVWRGRLLCLYLYSHTKFLFRKPRFALNYFVLETMDKNFTTD